MTNGVYEASNDGQIRNARTKYVKRQWESTTGSMCVSIWGYNNRNYTVAQLVWNAFDGRKCRIRHINGDKSDNRIENLEPQER